MSDDGVFHDEIEIEDFEYDEETELFTYPCPCGDLFTITKVCILFINLLNLLALSGLICASSIQFT